MKIGVCGIACEKCPRMQKNTCPNGPAGCMPRQNKFCKIATCAVEQGVKTCFDCGQFPCEITAGGPIALGYCQYIAGKDQ